MEVGTKVHRPLDHSYGINVLRSTKEGPLELRKYGILNKGAREHSRVIDGMILGMRMQGKKMGGVLTISLVKA